MAAQPENRENFTIQDGSRAASKPAIDPSQFWNDRNPVKLDVEQHHT